MNVLEKILEEIEDHAIEFESFGMCDDYVSVGWAKDISPVLYPGAWNCDYFKDRNRRGSRARRSRLSSGWRVSDTVIVIFLD